MTEVRCRKKRFCEAGLRTVELRRGRAGYGFSLSGQQPCVLSCVVRGSAAERSGLHTGDYLVTINSRDVTNSSHDDVVAMVGSASGLLVVQVANTLNSSDSSDDARAVGPQRPKYANRRGRSSMYVAAPRNMRQLVDVGGSSSETSSGGGGCRTKHTIITREARLGYARPASMPKAQPAPPANCIRVVIGYVGSIELPRSWAGSWGSVEGAVRRLRAEGRTPMRVLLQTSPGAGVRLQNGAGRLVAQYPPDVLLSCAECPDDRRYLAVMTARNGDECACHVFRVEPRVAAHAVHARTAAQFGVLCTRDHERRSCAEFPSSAVPVLQGIASVCRGEANTTPWKPEEGSTSEWSTEPSELHSLPNIEDELSDGEQSAENMRRGVHRIMHARGLHADVTPQERRRAGMHTDITPRERHHGVSSLSDDSDWAQRRVVPSHRPAVSVSPSPHRTDPMYGYVTCRSPLTPPPVLKHCIQLSPRRKESQGYNSDPGEGSVRGDRPVLPPEGQEEQDLSIEPSACHNKTSRMGAASSLSAIPTVPSGDEASNDNSGTVSDDVSPSVTRAASWAVNFNYLLNDEIGVANFREFLKKEFSEENITFWEACEAYKKIIEADQRKIRASDIFAHHLMCTAPAAVNVDSVARNSVQRAMVDAPSDLFDVPQQQICQLMRQDSYGRFLRSPLYKDCVLAEVEGRPLPCGDTSSTTDGSDRQTAADQKAIKKSKSACGKDEKRRRSLLPWNRNRRISQQIPIDTDMPPSGGHPQSVPAMTICAPVDDLCPKVSLDLADLKTMSREWKAIATPTDMAGCTTTTTPTTATAAPATSDKLCRVTLPDGCTTVMAAGQTLHSALARLCARRTDICLLRHAVINTTTQKLADLSADVSAYGWQELRLDRRTLLRVDIASNARVGLQVAPSCSVREAIAPLCQRYGIRTQAWVAHLFASSTAIDLDSKVECLDCRHVIVQTAEEFNDKKHKDWGSGTNSRRSGWQSGRWTQTKMAATTTTSSDSDKDANLASQVFKDLCRPNSVIIFDEQGIWDPHKKVEDRTKTDNGVRSSGILGLIRRNRVEKNRGKPRALPPSGHGVKPAGRKAWQDRDGERLMELLSRAQRRQLDDQRGVGLQDTELPDFLKLPPSPTPVEPTPHSSDSDGLRFVDCSFSRDGVVPSNQVAESYFSHRGSPPSSSSCHFKPVADSGPVEVSLLDASAYANGAAPQLYAALQQANNSTESDADNMSSSTPSPTTHDLVLLPDSSPDSDTENVQHADCKVALMKKVFPNSAGMSSDNVKCNLTFKQHSNDTTGETLKVSIV